MFAPQGAVGRIPTHEGDMDMTRLLFTMKFLSRILGVFLVFASVLPARAFVDPEVIEAAYAVANFNHASAGSLGLHAQQGPQPAGLAG